MVNKVAHILKPNAARQMPKWVIFLDTETKEQIIDDKTKKLILKLGYAILTRRTNDNLFRTVSEVSFTSAAEFTDWLERCCVGRERFYLTAHNIGFDVRIVGLLDWLHQSGWKRTLFIDDNINFIARYRKCNTTIKLINNQQLFNTSLRKLGESISYTKASVDFATVGDAELLEYCKRDVEVMRQAWNLWVRFVKDNDLGNFQITAASQAFSAFRHRFMDTQIYIHNHDKATALERESYHGGRVECFFIGNYTASKVYCLDVNSMYPFVMKEKVVPIKLIKHYDKPTLELFKTVRESFGYIVEATLQIEKPILPVVREGRLLFPTGVIKGVFTKPELELALQSGSLREVSKLNVYEERKIFARFVDFFYNERLKFREQGNVAFAYISKILMNYLYGKFAQKQLEYKKVGKSKSLPDGFYSMAWNGGSEYCKVRVINGIVEKTDGYKEGFNSFVAIASYITAEARVFLYSLIEQAGRENVLYCDTDSLFVNEIGFSRLENKLGNTALGALKVEGINDAVTIRAPKWYKFGDKSVHKGIRGNAIELSPNVFEQDKFVSFRGSLRAYDTHGVNVKRVVKHLNPVYHKGVVSDSGFVSPVVLS